LLLVGFFLSLAKARLKNIYIEPLDFDEQQQVRKAVEYKTFSLHQAVNVGCDSNIQPTCLFQEETNKN
jgi:hypothetical protein